MRKIHLIIGLIIQINVFGQSTTDLDKKGGFREFKIGDDIALHKDKITFSKSLENADTKQYLGKEKVKVKSYFGEIELKFYKEKLIEIVVIFKKTSPIDFDDLKHSLRTLYGEPTDESSASDKPKYLENFEKVYLWNGETIGLQLNYDSDYKLSEMVYWGLKTNLEKLKDEF